MAIASPAYRARIFKPRSQQPDPDHPTLLLVPRAGSLHSEPFLVATIPGVADDSPIPDVVDPINGATFNRPVPPAPPGRLVFGQWNVPATAGPFTHLSQATIGGTCTAFSGASVLDFVGGVKGASCTSYTGGLGGGGGYAYQGFFYEGAKRDELQPNHAYVMRLLMWTRPSGLGFEAKGMREYVLPGVLAGGGADSGLGVTPKYFDVHVTSDAGGNVGWALGGFDLEFGSSYVVMLGGMALFDPSLEPEDPNSGGIPSGGDYRPFLALPRGRRGRVDIRSKKTDVGALTLTILDQYVDPTSSTNAERWVTQFWGDEGAKAAMSTCLAVVEESLDGGVTWAPFYTGRVTNARLKGKVELSISVKDLGESLDRDVFVGEPIGVSYARRLPIIPLGLTENWGPLLGTAPLLPGNARLGREGRPYWFRTGLSVSDDADFRGHSKIPAALADLANRTVQPAGTGQQIYLFAPKVARVRITVGSTVTWWWLRQILAELVEEHDAEHWRPRDVLVDPAPELNPTPATFPSSGTDLTWAIYHGPPTVTEASPLLIDDVDPVTFLADLVDGRFSPPDADGNPRPLAPRDPTSWAALAGQLGTWRGFITEKGKARTWAAEHIGQLFQVGLALNAAGQCVLLDLRRGGDPSGFPEIPATEILSAPQAEGAEQNAEEAITRIVAPTPYVRQLDRTEAFAEVEDDHPDVPPGLLAVDEVPDQYLAFGDPRVADFGDQPVTLPMTGLTLIVEGREGLDPAVLVADQTARRTLQQRLADDVFALFAHGPEYFTVVCTRHGVAETTQVGDRRRVTAPALPNAQTNLRGGTRAGLCLERSEDGPKVTLAFVALGLAAEGDPPTFPDPPAQSVEDCATSVTVPVELNAAGDPVMIEWAATAIGDARPADGSAAWRFGARLTASGTALLTGLPSGSRIHLRVRSVPPASSASPFPSPWTATDPAYVETCGLEVLADCAIEIGANGARILTWTGGDPDLPVLIRVDGVLVATVPAGTTRWNTSGYTGTVSIAQHDGAGGTVEGCSVVITGGAGQCPRPAGIQVLVPSAISVAGFPARVSDGTIFGWQLERAPDVSGAPDEGALEVVAGDVEGSPSGAAVVIVDPQPVTGTTWWYRLRHVLAGWTESDPTCWRSGVAQLGTPPQPVPTLPVVTLTAKSQTEAEGTVTWALLDPQCRVTLVEIQTRAGVAEPSAWTAVSEPYTGTVALMPGMTSSVAIRVTGFDVDGIERVLLETTEYFGLEPLPPEPSGPATSDEAIPLITEEHFYDEIGPDVFVLGEIRQDWWTFRENTAGLLTATVAGTTLPETARLVVEYLTDDGTTWAELGAIGPELFLGPENVALWPGGVVDGLAVLLTVTGRRRFRLVIKDGDGTGYLFLKRAELQLTVGAPVTTPPETPEPPFEPEPPVNLADLGLWYEPTDVTMAGPLVDTAHDKSSPATDAAGTGTAGVTIEGTGGAASFVFNALAGGGGLTIPGAVKSSWTESHLFLVQRGDGPLDIGTSGWMDNGPGGSNYPWLDGLVYTGYQQAARVSFAPPSFRAQMHVVELISRADGRFIVRATDQDGNQVELYNAPGTFQTVATPTDFGAGNGTIHFHGRLRVYQEWSAEQTGEAIEHIMAYMVARARGELPDFNEGPDGGSGGPPPGPQEPPPEPPTNPPPPITGGAIFGMAEIDDEAGFGPWNSTIVRSLTPSNAVAKLAAMAANGMQQIWQAQGPQALWNPGGVFNINLYVQQVRRWKTPSAARDAVLEAIANGVIRYGFLGDELYHKTRYGPGGVPLHHVRTMAAVYREVFEDLPLTTRAEPTFWDNQPIPGLTDYWYTVKVNRGPIAVKVAQYTALAANNGCGLGCSINCRDFNNTGGGVDAANDPGGWITPAQFALYGGQLAAFSSLKFFHGWWMLDPQWYQVAGMAAAVLGVRTKWIATHP